MTTSTPNLPENYTQEILETYADGVEKHKDSKSLLVDLLKKSDVLGKRINTFQDYKDLQEAVAQQEANGSLSSLQKLGLKELKKFITTEYPQYGQEWLANKHKTEQETLNQKHQGEKESFSKLFPQSPETQNQYLSGAYIDNLIQKNNLEKGSINQLNTIKYLLTKHNTKIDANRLTIRKNLVCIDGFTIPAKKEDRKTQYYKEMKKNPEGLTYPGYAKALLNFNAEITKTQFTFPANRDKLQKGEIDGEAFKKEINTPANKAIIKTLCNIVGFDSVIPVGLDKNGYVIYVDVRSGFCGFGRYSNGDYGINNCLVSAA